MATVTRVPLARRRLQQTISKLEDGPVDMPVYHDYLLSIMF